VPISFHLDEHIPSTLADALRSRGIDVTTTAEVDLSGAPDREHLSFALSAGRVLVTQDLDFVRLHAEGLPHAGVTFWRQRTRSIGEVVRRLLLMHALMTPDEMKNRVEYL
jgi:predicted nuclease of predicted toxin-antitoxin system